MRIAAITGYNVSLFLHITAAIVGFGATFAELIMFPVALKLDVRHLPYVHRLQLAINRGFASPALAIVVATGFYQVAEGHWDLGKLWISASLGLVIVLGFLIGAYFIPTGRRLAKMVENEIAAAGDGEVVLSDEYQRGARSAGIVGTLAGAIVVVVVFLMVTKPGL